MHDDSDILAADAIAARLGLTSNTQPYSVILRAIRGVSRRLADGLDPWGGFSGPVALALSIAPYAGIREDDDIAAFASALKGAT